MLICDLYTFSNVFLTLHTVKKMGFRHSVQNIGKHFSDIDLHFVWLIQVPVVSKFKNPSSGFDLMYLTVRQVKSKRDQRGDFTWIQLPVLHKELMFLIFCPLCILTVHKLSMKPESIFQNEALRHLQEI